MSARASFDYAEENMGHNFLVRFFGFVVQLRQQQRSDCHWH